MATTFAVVMLSGTLAHGFDIVEFPICTETGDQGLPGISGSNVIWVDNRAGGDMSKIYGKTLSSGSEFNVATSETHITYSPAIDGDIVVWGDSRNLSPDGDYDFYGYNIFTQTEFVIWEDDSPRPHIDIDGDIVVGVERSYQNLTSYDIYGYNLSTQARFLICDAPDYQYVPQIDGNIVIWKDLRAGGEEWDIYGYDLSQSSEFSICTVATGLATRTITDTGWR